MHKQAALNTAKVMVTAILIAGSVVAALQYMTFVLFMSILGAGVVGYMIYIFYCIERDRLNHIESINKLKAKQND